MNYVELRQCQQERVNTFSGLIFAFSNKQLEEGMARYGLTLKDTRELVGLGCGTFVLKDRREAFLDMLEHNEKELKQLLSDKTALLDALIYELQNHEYCVTGDPEDALDALGLKFEDVPKDILREATQQCQGEW